MYNDNSAVSYTNCRDPVFAEAADAGTKSVDMIKGSAMSTDFDAVSLNGMSEG